MRKKLIVTLIALVFVLPAAIIAVKADVTKATLINSNGDKVVVASGSLEAQYWFGKGYVLIGAEQQLGAAGSVYNSMQAFNANYTVGGRVMATSTSQTAATLSFEELTKETIRIDITPNRPTLALTMMASSSMPWLDRNGKTHTVWMYNASSSAAEITLTAANNQELQEEQGGVVVIGYGEYARVTFFKNTITGHLAVIAEVFQAGD